MNPQCLMFILLATISGCLAFATYKPTPKLTYLCWYVLQVEGSKDCDYYTTTSTWENPPEATELVSSAREVILRDNTRAKEPNMKLVVLSMSKLETNP